MTGKATKIKPSGYGKTLRFVLSPISVSLRKNNKMNFRIGDNVKFLDATGGGVISKIISASMVYVEDEDGFEIPTMTSNLVKMTEDKDSAASMFDTNYKARPKAKAEERKPPVEYENRISPLEKYPAKGDNKPGVYLAVVPHDQQWLITGLLDIFIINYTPTDVLFSIFLKDPLGKYLGYDYDVVPANSKILIDTIDREHLDQWKEGIVQAIFHEEESLHVFAPASCNFRIKLSKLFKEDNFKTSSFLGGKSFLLSLVELESHTRVAEHELDQKFENRIIISEAVQAKTEVLIEKHRVSPREAIVDLHIGELVNDYTKLSNSEMLELQVQYFVKCLESAITNGFYRIVFIHGVGNQILKNKVNKLLSDYSGLEVRDASMAKFGYGATEVLIPKNRVV